MGSRGIRATALALIAFAGTASVGVGAEGGRAAVPRIKLEDFKKEFDQDKLLVVDVRGPEAYRAGHIPGAINVPLAEIGGPSQSLARLKASKKPIVTYCA